MTPLKTFSNAKTALHWNKSSCLLHTGQIERHHLFQLYKTNTRFLGEKGAQSPSELNHFPFCLGNYRALSATASLQLQNPNPKNNSKSFPYIMRDARIRVLRASHEGSEKPSCTENESPSTFVCRQETKRSKFHTQSQYLTLPPLPWPP